MHTLTLELSDAELGMIRTALADYACLAIRMKRERSAEGAVDNARAWHALEVAVMDVLGRLPEYFSAPRALI